MINYTRFLVEVIAIQRISETNNDEDCCQHRVSIRIDKYAYNYFQSTTTNIFNSSTLSYTIPEAIDGARLTDTYWNFSELIPPPKDVGSQPINHFTVIMFPWLIVFFFFF
jgi:hypothetical protein